MIEVKRFSVRYAGADSWALRDVDLRVEPGEFVFITGPSGCGKSTLLRCLAGIVPRSGVAHQEGSVTVGGLDVAGHPVAELAKRVGLVFQNPATQLFNLRVDEEIAFGPRNLKLSPGEVAGRVDFALHSVGIEELRERPIRSLSGGEQQKVAIASVLAMRPQVLILDEPTSNLDWKGTGRVLEALERLNRQYGLTILVVEHRLHALEKLAGRVVIMHEGRIALDGPPAEIFAQKELLNSLGMPYPWRLVERGHRDYLPEGIAPPQADGPPLVEMRGIVAGYGRQTILQDVDLSIHPGQFVALVGDNGAGKSTLSRVLAGLLRPRRGQVIWAGKDKQRIGILFQNPLHQLLCEVVEDEVSFGPRNFGLFDAGEIEAILEATALASLRHKRPQALSVGQQQRVALAAALSLRPHLLILDEPTMGQDWGHLSRFMDFLARLNREGQTILLITHDDKLVCRYARRVVSLHEGRIVADGELVSPALTLQRGRHTMPGVSPPTQGH